MQIGCRMSFFFVSLQTKSSGDGMEFQKEIIVTDRLGVVRTDSEKEYLAHLLCLGGTCRYRFNERDFELHAGDLSIIRKRKMVEKIQPSDDFRRQDNLCHARICRVVYAPE